MSKTLQGKVAVVTGGSRGIRAVIALEFAKRGASAVAITYVSNAAAAAGVVDQLHTLGARATAIKADTANIAAGPIIVDAVLKDLDVDGIDILVNNAGVIRFTLPFLEATVEDFSYLFDVNLRGPIFITQAVLKVIRPGGRIIMISSKASRLNLPSPYALYGATKAAMENIVRSIAIEFAAPLKITVNTIMPGAIDTDMITVAAASISDYLKTLPTAEKRLGTVDDIAQIAGFLAEEGSRWLNGETVSATGGELML